MKISEQWLREWIDPPVDIDQLAEQLTMAGLEVESVEKFSVAFSGVIVAKVKSVSEHPDSKKLHICQVEAGKKETFQIVCGANNVKAGMLVALAKNGASLPGNNSIRTTEVRGVKSNGMLCSSAELGLTEEAEGILELPPDLKPGQDLKKIITRKDNVLEISLTPNRGDCLSVIGIAREIAVLNRLKFKNPTIKAIKNTHGKKRKVVLNAPGACSHYVGRIIRGINNNCIAPLWLTERLQRSGIRSINPVVDVTNYVMLELGQPMHAFDENKLEGSIHVRYARNGEKLSLLDERLCELNDKVLVIADDINVLAMAGIMGGLDSAVSEQSTDIFLESAYFDPVAISGQARNYGIHTESSHRFERGVDYTLQKPAIERATQLIMDICGGKAGPVIEATAKNRMPVRAKISLHDNEIERLLGLSIPSSTVTTILKALGMQVVRKPGNRDVIPPTHRFDLSIEADLIEELARVYGYNNIPAHSLYAVQGFHSSQQDTSFLRTIRSLLVNRGYQEAITYSFVDKKLQDILTPDRKDIELANPIAADQSVMRTSMWPGLLQALLYNLHRQQSRVRLFETGLIYQRVKGKIRQEPAVGGVIYGNNYIKQWDREDYLCDYFDIKSDIEEILASGRCDSQAIEFRQIEYNALHPGQSAEIFYNNQKVGMVGALHPAIQLELEIPQQVYLFELYIRGLSKKIAPKYQKISKFPIVNRDIAILVDEGVTLANIMDCIRKSAPDTLINLELFDVYRGEGIDLGKKSLALGLTFQGSSSTLTDEEVEATMGEILASLKNGLGGVLRE